MYVVLLSNLPLVRVAILTFYLWGEEKFQPFWVSFEHETLDEKDGDHNVWKQCSEIYNLKGLNEKGGCVC